MALQGSILIVLFNLISPDQHQASAEVIRSVLNQRISERLSSDDANVDFCVTSKSPIDQQCKRNY